MINSRSLYELSPEVHIVCERHIDLCKDSGVELLVTSTYRDYESQSALYTQGRTRPGSIVTNARAGQSWHNFRCAWDVVPLIDGKCVWTAHNKSGSLVPLWQLVVDMGKSAGAEAGADWLGRLQDIAHFQFCPVNLTLTVARARFERSGTIFVV